MSMVCAETSFVYCLYVETERSESVVATYHGAHGVFHPSIVEVSLAHSQRLDKLAHAAPRCGTHSFGLLSVCRHPLLPFPDVAGMLNLIFILCHQVGIDRLANCRYPDFFHIAHILTCCRCHSFVVIPPRCNPRNPSSWHARHLPCSMLPRLPRTRRHCR